MLANSSTESFHEHYMDITTAITGSGTTVGQHHATGRDNPGVEPVRTTDTSAHQVVVTRCPRGGHLVASLRWPRHTGCSSEVLGITLGCIRLPGFAPKIRSVC